VTIRELILVADQHSIALAAVFAGLPVAAWLCRLMHGPKRGGSAPWKYLYSLLVYLACVPGVFAGVLTAYTLWFTRENLLDVSFIVYVVPILSMVVTLALIGRSVEFDQVPGFDRLWGLMVMIGCSFGIALFIQKTSIWVVFGGSIGWLFLLALVVFVLLKWGAHMLFRRRDEPEWALPKFPGM
jgi:hypothetical protein